MTTNELVDRLAEHWDLSHAEARRILDTFVETITDHLAAGNSFTIPELGTFGTKTRDSRKSYNPHYEQYMMLPPKRVVDFTPSKGLKEDLKDLEQDHE